jgi:hypothetical protein
VHAGVWVAAAAPTSCWLAQGGVKKRYLFSGPFGGEASAAAPAVAAAGADDADDDHAPRGARGVSSAPSKASSSATDAGLLAAFLRAALAGEWPPHLRSAPAPAAGSEGGGGGASTAGVAAVVTETFFAQVGGARDVLLLVYSPSCRACQAFAPTFEAWAAAVRDGGLAAAAKAAKAAKAGGGVPVGSAVGGAAGEGAGGGGGGGGGGVGGVAATGGVGQDEGEESTQEGDGDGDDDGSGDDGAGGGAGGLTWAPLLVGQFDSSRNDCPLTGGGKWKNTFPSVLFFRAGVPPDSQAPLEVAARDGAGLSAFVRRHRSRTGGSAHAGELRL